MKQRFSLLIPVRDEVNLIDPLITQLRENLSGTFECLLIVDNLEDPTVTKIREYETQDPRFKLHLNCMGAGPARAIRSGISASSGRVKVVMMADGSDDVRDVMNLVALVERGIQIACASRYLRPGRQIGAPVLKSLLSRMAGLTLFYFARVGTRDATNSFKAYEGSFIDQIEIESEHGFTMGLELVAKARRNGAKVAELPTIWIERSEGKSNFKLLKWIPHYVKWYFYAFRIGKCT